MRLLGHRNIQNTLTDTQLVDFRDDEYITHAATTIKEAIELGNAGYEYFTEIEGSQLFRKRK